MAEDKKFELFRRQLEEEYSWPSLYMFKFIVPKGKEGEVEKLFPRNELKIRESNQGNYVSLTVQLMANSSDEIISIYTQAHGIEGLIAL